MKTSSAKAKGRRLQDAVVDSLYNKYKILREGDIKPAIMGESGRDVKLSPAAEDIIPFDIECKNQETTSVWAWMKQAEENVKGDRIPLVIFKRNHSKTYALLEWETLLEILNGSK
jgi:hypothetical protein